MNESENEGLDIPNVLDRYVPRPLTDEALARIRGSLTDPSTSVGAGRPVGRTRWVRWLVSLSVAACVLILAGLGLWRMFPLPTGPTAPTRPERLVDAPKAADGLIVLSPPPARGAGKPLPPYWLEAQADVVAVAVMGKAESRGGRKVIRLELVEVLKGRQPSGPLESSDEVAVFGCIAPQRPESLTEMFRPGERVAVYLRKNDSGWSTLQMLHLTGDGEAEWKERVQPFFDVLLASTADDPAQRYAQLLAQGDKVHRRRNQATPGITANEVSRATSAPQPGLTEASYYALFYNADPHAAASVRELLLPRAQDKGAAAPPAMENKWTRTNVASSIDIPNSPLAYATLLARMHDAASIRPVLSALAARTSKERVAFLRLLPDLCRDSDVETLRHVQAELNKYIEAHEAGEPDEYRRTLDETRRSIERLLSTSQQKDR